MNEPDVIRAGDTVVWEESPADYPPPTWMLSYTWASKLGTFSTTASELDGRHSVKLTPAETGIIQPGQYQWVATVTDGVDRFSIGEGTMQVLPDLASSPDGQETRTWAKRALDAIEATLENTATTDQASYSLGGVTISRMAIGDLLAWRDRLRWEVSQEENAERLRKGLPSTHNINVRL